MLTTGGKDFLATNAGASSCFQPSGISYSDPDGGAHTGATGDVANAFYVAHLVGKDTVLISNSKTYNDLKAANGNNDISITDVGWVYDNDGGSGELQYCLVGIPTPTPTGTPAPGYANITIDSIPQGALISGDVTETYRLTPETFVMMTGSKDITLKKDGYVNYEHTIYVSADDHRTYTWTMTPESEKPVEIRVIPPQLRGSVAIGQSTIPRELMQGVQARFRMHVDNMGKRARFRTTLRLAYITIPGEQYTFSSDWSDPCEFDDYVNCEVYVTMPLTCSLGDYDLWTVLEAEAV